MKDSLDVVTTTITETFGEIELDSGETDTSDNVQLDFGGEVFVPSLRQSPVLALLSCIRNVAVASQVAGTVVLIHESAILLNFAGGFSG